MLALERGWIPNSGNLVGEQKIEEACKNEDSGVFRCVLKKRSADKSILDAPFHSLHQRRSQRNNNKE